MRRAFVRALAVTGLTLAPTLAVAQHDMSDMAGHEVGVDLGIAFIKPSSTSGILSVGTPIDVRLGLPMGGWSLEPRLILLYQSKSGNDLHNIDFDLNALFPVGRGNNYRKGLYLTAGGGLDLTGGNLSGLPSMNATLVQLNAGIGTRVPLEPGAIRIEGYLKYHFANRNTGYVNTSEFGVRLGLSLWH